MKNIYFEQAKDSDFAKLIGQEVFSIKTDGNNSALTDEAMKLIPYIVGLRELDIEWATQITDEGIAALALAPSLNYVDLSFCSNVSEQAILELKARNSNITIDR